jgi:hypothetical protein
MATLKITISFQENGYTETYLIQTQKPYNVWWMVKMTVEAWQHAWDDSYIEMRRRGATRERSWLRWKYGNRESSDQTGE